MADRDIFTRGLGRNWSSVGRQAANRQVAARATALGACHAIRRTLNRSGGIPGLLFGGLCDIVTSARDERRNFPLFEDSSREYKRRQAIRALCRRFSGVTLGEVLEEAASRVLVEERTKPPGALAKADLALAQAVAMEIFEEQFGGPVIALLQQEGFSADEARERVDACRQEMVGLEEFDGLVRSVARRPQSVHHRVHTKTKVKAATKDLLHQPLVPLAAGAAVAER